jgi:hypothetical protein
MGQFGRYRAWGLGQSTEEIPVPSAGDLASVVGSEVGAPTRADVDAYVSEIETYVPDVPIDWEDLTPDEARAWVEEGLSNWARINNIELSEEGLRAAAEGYAREQVEAELGYPLPDSYDEALDVALEMAVTAACNAAGIDPRLGFVTYEALSDGDFDEADCIAIGRVTGSIAGAAIGQMFGIPAPIGSFVGGIIGGAVGRWFADSFHIGEDPRPAIWEARREALEEWFLQAWTACRGIRANINHNHEMWANQLIKDWTRAELEIGVQFDLRWFGVRSGPGGRYNCFEEYGCLYGDRLYSDWRGAYQPRNTFEQITIVQKVYAALGEPGPIYCTLEEPTPGQYQWYARESTSRYQWMDAVMAQVRRAAAAFWPLRARYVQVVSDLMRTASIVAAEKRVAEEKLELATGGTNTLRAARERGAKKRAIVNGGAMVLGLGFVGWVLLQGRR